jgi:hypothetical protein
MHPDEFQECVHPVRGAVARSAVTCSAVTCRVRLLVGAEGVADRIEGGQELEGVGLRQVEDDPGPTELLRREVEGILLQPRRQSGRHDGGLRLPRVSPVGLGLLGARLLDSGVGSGLGAGPGFGLDCGLGPGCGLGGVAGDPDLHGVLREATHE